MKRIYRIKDGFSLMEMMVVMLVVAIVMALSAPMITKKTSGAGAGSCLWTSLTGGNIGFNANQDAVSAVIGGNNSEITALGANIPKLTIATNGTYPQIGFLHSDSASGTLMMGSNNSIVLGNNANTLGSNSIAIGTNANAATAGSTYSNSVAIGYFANAGGNNAVAIGNYANSYGTGDHVQAIAIGNNASASGSDSIAIGEGPTASGNHGIAIGLKTLADKDYSTALGYAASANGFVSTAIGYHAIANASDSIAIGNYAVAKGRKGIAIGQYAQGANSSSIGIGYSALAKHPYSVAIGHVTSTTAANQIVLGNSKTTVYIPGNLVVGNYTWLGADMKIDDDNTSALYLNFTVGKGTITEMSRIYEVGGDDNTLYRSEGKDYSVPYSDRRLKDIIGENLDAMDKINRIKVYDFTFKKDDLKTPHVGVIAQELQKVFPNAVTKDENGYLQIRHEDMFFTMINALKELDAKIKQIALQLADNIKIVASDSEKIRDLTIRVNNQDKEIKALKKEVAELRKIVNKLAH